MVLEGETAQGEASVVVVATRGIGEESRRGYRRYGRSRKVCDRTATVGWSRRAGEERRVSEAEGKRACETVETGLNRSIEDGWSSGSGAG